MRLPAFVSVCLSVSKMPRLLKNTCINLDEMLRVDRCDVGTWTNLLIFVPDTDHSPDPKTVFTLDF